MNTGTDDSSCGFALYPRPFCSHDEPSAWIRVLTIIHFSYITVISRVKKESNNVGYRMAHQVTFDMGFLRDLPTIIYPFTAAV